MTTAKSDNSLQLQELYSAFRDADTIRSYAKLIEDEAKKLTKPLHIMEVCGGHTHTIMKYALKQLLPQNIHFIHGPGCPVCVMPKERIDHAIVLSKLPDIILVTLGDMIKVPGSSETLQDARAQGADVRFVYSPTDCIKIAKENQDKTIIFFAIGFETTTPMSAALLNKVVQNKTPNILFHINHVSVPEPMRALLEDRENKIDAFIAPSHVSVITGAKIYEEFVRKYKKPIVVSGFEPVDMMQSIYMLLKSINENKTELQIQYTRSVNYEGNTTAQELCDTFFEKRDSFRWRGIGEIAQSALKIKKEFSHLDAELLHEDILPKECVEDHPLCICGDVLKGKASPKDCKVFDSACKPSSPLGSCMVSSEGACAAYYKYGGL
jgi:hydrogenase expression/formation protein HypD